jgi:hypothetical protein
MIGVQHYLSSVFPSVTVDSQTIITKKIPHKNHKVLVSILGKQGTIDYEVEQTYWQSCTDTSINVYQSSPAIRNLSQKLSSQDKLEKFFKITQGAKPFQIGKGIPKQTPEILETQPYVSEFKKDKTFQPLLRGSLINKYLVLWNNDYWISFGVWLAEPRYSASYDAEKKIVIRQTGDSLICTLDTNQFIVRDNLYTIVPKDGLSSPISINALCGLLNSRLLNWYYKKVINSEEGEGLAQVKRTHIALLPLPEVTNHSILADINKAVLSMLSNNKELHELSAKFLAMLKAEFGLEKPGTKLEPLNFSQFVAA